MPYSVGTRLGKARKSPVTALAICRIRECLFVDRIPDSPESNSPDLYASKEDPSCKQHRIQLLPTIA